MEAIHTAASSGTSNEEVRDTILAPARGKPWFDYFGEFDAADWDFFLLNISAEATFDPEFYLNRVTCPTLTIFGEMDSLIPVARNIEILQETVAKSSSDLMIKVFPNGTHRLIPVDGSAEFVPGYFKFMRE